LIVQAAKVERNCVFTEFFTKVIMSMYNSGVALWSSTGTVVSTGMILPALFYSQTLPVPTAVVKHLQRLASNEAVIREFAAP